MKARLAINGLLVQEACFDLKGKSVLSVPIEGSKRLSVQHVYDMETGEYIIFLSLNDE